MMKAAVLVTGGRFLLRLMSLFSLMILARLLSPEDYGIAALAVTALGLVQVLSDIQIPQGLVAAREVTPAHLNTAFTLALMRAVLIATVVLAGAEYFAHFMNQPALTHVLRVLAVVAIIDGLQNPAFTLFRRNIDFSREVGRQAIATLVSTIVTIVVAYYLRNYWAIVCGAITLRLVVTTLSYWRVPYLPRLGLKEWRLFTGIGVWLSLMNICEYINNSAPQFIISKGIGSSALGGYSVGREISTIATREIALPLMGVIFPGFAAISHDMARLRVAYREVQATIFGLAFPIGLGCAVFAQELVLVLAGAKWFPSAVPVIEVLAPLTALGMINSGTGSLAVARSQSGRLFWRSFLTMAISYPLLLAGLWLGGFQGVIYALAIHMLLTIIVTSWFSSRLAGDRLLSPIIACWRSLVAGAVMCLVLALVKTPIAPSASIREALFHALPLVALGGLTYIGVHILLWIAAGRPRGFEARMFDFGRMALRRS